MKLEGSCHCGAVRFSLESAHPCPFNLCYCIGCRKTAGTGGFAINLSGDASTLVVEGREAVVVYRPGHPTERGEGPSPQERHFCGRCGTALWIFDPTWPELIHPHASAIDTELPVAPERSHLMLDFRAGWVPLQLGPGDKTFPRYPDESIAEWHERVGQTR